MREHEKIPYDSFAFQNIVYDIGRTDAGAIGIEWFAGFTAAKPELQVGEPEISGLFQIIILHCNTLCAAL